MRKKLTININHFARITNYYQAPVMSANMAKIEFQSEHQYRYKQRSKNLIVTYLKFTGMKTKSFSNKLTFLVHLRTRWNEDSLSQALWGFLSISASFRKKKLLKKWNLAFCFSCMLFFIYLPKLRFFKQLRYIHFSLVIIYISLYISVCLYVLVITHV